MPAHNEGPFTSFSTFLRVKDEMRVSSNSDASLCSSSSDESSNNNDDMIWKEFKAFGAREAGKCAHINDLQRWPSKELLAVTIERLSAVIALRPSMFRYLQENEELSLIRKSLHSAVYKLLRIVQMIFCRTAPNEDEKLFSTLNKLEFRLSRTWGMPRSKVICLMKSFYFVFPPRPTCCAPFEMR